MRQESDTAVSAPSRRRDSAVGERVTAAFTRSHRVGRVMTCRRSAPPSVHRMRAATVVVAQPAGRQAPDTPGHMSPPGRPVVSSETMIAARRSSRRSLRCGRFDGRWTEHSGSNAAHRRPGQGGGPVCAAAVATVGPDLRFEPVDSAAGHTTSNPCPLVAAAARARRRPSSAARSASTDLPNVPHAFSTARRCFATASASCSSAPSSAGVGFARPAVASRTGPARPAQVIGQRPGLVGALQPAEVGCRFGCTCCWGFRLRRRVRGQCGPGVGGVDFGGVDPHPRLRPPHPGCWRRGADTARDPTGNCTRTSRGPAVRATPGTRPRLAAPPSRRPCTRR